MSVGAAAEAAGLKADDRVRVHWAGWSGTATVVTPSDSCGLYSNADRYIHVRHDDGRYGAFPPASVALVDTPPTYRAFLDTGNGCFFAAPTPAHDIDAAAAAQVAAAVSVRVERVLIVSDHAARVFSIEAAAPSAVPA